MNVGDGDATAAVHGRVWRDGELVRRDFQLADLDTLLADQSNLVWLDLVKPDPALLTQLATELRFDPHIVEDALAPRERPKVSHYAGHLFLTVYAVRLGPASGYGSRLRTSRVSAMVVERGLITVRLDDGFDMVPVEQQWADDQRLLSLGVGGLLHGLLDTVVDQHFDVIEQIDDGMEQLENMLFEDAPQTHHLQRHTYQLRRELVELRRIVLPMRDVVQSVLRDSATHEQEHPELRAYYEDLSDHVLRENEWTESLRDLVSSVYETNLALNDARMNVIMKKLTGWAAIIAVPTLITGWYGQNVPYPGYGTWWGFLATLMLNIIGVSVLYVLFRRNDWL